MHIFSRNDVIVKPVYLQKQMAITAMEISTKANAEITATTAVRLFSGSACRTEIRRQNTEVLTHTLHSSLIYWCNFIS